MDLKPQVESRLTSLADFAKGQYQERGSFIPMLEIMGAKDTGEPVSLVVVLAGPAINDRFKILKKLGQDIGTGKLPDKTKINPYAVIFAAETWLSHTPGVMPSEAKDRQEALTAMYQMIDGKGGFASWFIKRGDKIELTEYKNVETVITDKGENNLLKSFWDGYFSIVKKS